MDESVFGTAEEYGMEEKHALLLKKMKYFHSFCVKHGIEYSVHSGTALGTIRHNGFIPWDDDIDLVITRENLDKVLEYQHEMKGFTLKNWRYIYHLVSEEAEKDGAGFDFFVYDNVPNSKLVASIKLFLIRLLQRMFRNNPGLEKLEFDPVSTAITRALGYILPTQFKKMLFEKVSRIGNKKATKYIAMYNIPYKSLGEKREREFMEHLILHPFEDSYVYIMEQYDEYLTSAYGDYMTPPTPEQIQSKKYIMRVNGELSEVGGVEHRL